MPILDARVNVSRFGTDSFVVAAGGELDLFTSERLREKLADVLELGGRRILVDLTGGVSSWIPRRWERSWVPQRGSNRRADRWFWSRTTRA
ncbi:MAG TPA: hypothetical protein VLB89_04880 [Gaiellaceae bacterium]|nr:hypothetical protein [Gaiellaceae bacterium]